MGYNRNFGGVKLPAHDLPFQGPRDVPLDLRARREQTQPGYRPGADAPGIGFNQFDMALGNFRGDFLGDLSRVFIPRLERRAYHQLQAFNVGAAWVKARPEEPRVYFFIINNDAANNLFVAYAELDGTNGSIAIGPGGFYEPWVIPINEIWIRGAAANVNGILSIATSQG